jgi:hypothetical protein
MNVRRLSILIILALTGAIGGGTYYFYQQIEASEYESCVLSIEDGIRKGIANGDIKLKESVTDQWRVLDEDEEQMIFEKFTANGRKFDCKQFSSSEDGSSIRGDSGIIKTKLHGDVLLVRIETNDGRIRIVDPYGK